MNCDRRELVLMRLGCKEGNLGPPFPLCTPAFLPPRGLYQMPRRCKHSTLELQNYEPKQTYFLSKLPSLRQFVIPTENIVDHQLPVYLSNTSCACCCQGRAALPHLVPVSGRCSQFSTLPLGMLQPDGYNLSLLLSSAENHDHHPPVTVPPFSSHPVFLRHSQPVFLSFIIQFLSKRMG